MSAGPVPPLVCVAGASFTAYGGDSGVTNGEPVVPTPWSDVTTTPSLTIDLTFLSSADATLTVKWTETLPCAGTVSPLHWTLPLATVPPSCAAGDVVFAGTGSEIVTPVPAALPMFFSVSVYVMVLEGPTGVPASTFDRSNAGMERASSSFQAERPWVPAAIVRTPACDGSRSICQMDTVGKPVPSWLQVWPPL